MGKNKNPLVSILILNYNGKKFLDDCFGSIFNSTYSNVEILMIDNKSTDDSVEYTKINFPRVKIFENDKNGGFGYAYNKAFKIAEGKYFVILNNDVIVEPGWLEPLVERAENQNNIGALQPKLVSMTDPGSFEYAGASGGFMDKYGYPFARGRLFYHIEKDTGQYNDPARIFWASGAAMFVRAEVIQECGDIDEDFIHHMEEIDLCYRINLAGYHLEVIPSSVVQHFGGGVISYESFKKIYWNHRNSVFMLLKNLERKNIFKILFTRIFLDLATIGWSLFRFDFKRIAAIFAAYGWLIQHARMLKQKRKEVQAKRKVRDDVILNLLYPRSVALQYFLFKKKTYQELI